MNTSGQDHDAREWEAQEHARRQARAAAAAPGSPDAVGGLRRARVGTEAPTAVRPQDAGDASYRRVAEALRRPPPIDLPPDFAADGARVAGARGATPVLASAPSPMAAAEPAFERMLVRMLVLVFALCALAASAVYGARVFAQLRDAIGTQGLQWTALLAGCLALSWSFDWLRRHVGHGDDGQRLA
ncbi:MAG: hypothetical protein L0H23_03215 [Luteimonas sp.]|nr:hypothetical protein [Luteimonas sp.]